MREIKFRAYDRKTKKMLNSVGFYDSDCGRTLVEESYMIGGGETHNFYDFDYNTQKHRFELMQYTGLEDTKGKEIYEGDVVFVEVQIIGIRVLGQIVFREAMFCCITPILPDDSIPLYGVDKITVIGNIYENPELLEVKE